jgi:6-phosphofructokinase 1
VPRRAGEALAHLNVDDPESRRHYVVTLDRENTRTIDGRGGTVLHSSRTNPVKMQKVPDHLAAEDFPTSLSTKAPGVSNKVWDLSK